MDHIKLASEFFGLRQGGSRGMHDHKTKPHLEPFCETRLGTRKAEMSEPREIHITKTSHDASEGPYAHIFARRFPK